MPERETDRAKKKPHPYTCARRGRHSQKVQLPIMSNLTSAGYCPRTLMSRTFFYRFENGSQPSFPSIEVADPRDASGGRAVVLGLIGS